MDLLFYVILVVVILLKLLFWIFYFYARNRRRLQLQEIRQAQQVQQDRTRCEYEEQPAVPQPAYLITQYPFGMEVPATFQMPPEYSLEDPVKHDLPPPPYNDDSTANVNTAFEADDERQLLVDNQGT